LDINKLKGFIKKYTFYEVSMTTINCIWKYKLTDISLLIKKNPNFIERVHLKIHTLNKKVKKLK